MSGVMSQDQIIDNLSMYLMDVVIHSDTESKLEEAHMDGVITGIAIAVAVAAGAPGPATALELARMGTELAQAVVARVTGKEEEL